MERLLTRRLVLGISSFDGLGSPVTSLYLGVAPSDEGRKEVLLHFKDLVNKSSERLFRDRTHGEKASITGDLEKFKAYLQAMPRVDVSGLAMFSCFDKAFFEAVGVAAAFRPQLIVSTRPAVAPLVSALEDYKRIAVCLVDRRSAVLYEYFMGRMEEVKSFRDDVPGRIKFAGWGGFAERRIARNIESHEHVHLRNAAEALFEEIKLRGFDWLFLGVRADLREALENLLHPYVRERLKGYLDLPMSAPPAEVREKIRVLAERLKADENGRLVERLIETASAGGPAVTGLQKTLDALNKAAVGTLVISGATARKGVLCGQCGILGLKRSDCALCGGDMVPSDNIVEQAEEAALAQGASVRHIEGGARLDALEGIGAFTRFVIKNGQA